MEEGSAMIASTGKSLHVLMVVPSWKTRCGVASYSAFLLGGLEALGQSVEVWSDSLDGLVDYVNHRAFQLIHFQYQYSLYDLARLSRCVGQLALRRIPAVVTMHDVYPRMIRENEFIKRSFSALVVHGASMAKALGETGSQVRAADIIPIGCKVYPLPPAEQARNALGMRDEPAIGFFGHMAPHKGILELLRAARALRQSVPQLRCFVFSSVGTSASVVSQEHLDAVRSACDDERLWDGLTLVTDYLPDEIIASHLCAMSVNVLPYHRPSYYGASMAVRMMLAAGRPIITTDIPFFADLGPEVCKIPSQSPEFIVSAVLRILGDKDFSASLVRAVGEYVSAHGWGASARSHIELYQRVLRSPHIPDVLLFDGDSWK